MGCKQKCLMNLPGIEQTTGNFFVKKRCPLSNICLLLILYSARRDKQVEKNINNE